ncbi:9169_t:CDS:1, partial [Dentiscutata heterogama]
MTLAPITGKLRKRLIFDISAALGLGTVSAYAYWYGIHIPAVRKRDFFYAKLAQE